MDLVAGVRKEGSRGGTADFKWSDVTTSTHRENYLGHSLMAPVGRWQQNKDLSWYAKGDKSSAEAAEARREEIRKVKEAEQAAMGEALGFGPATAALVGAKGGNANETPLGVGKGREVEKVGGDGEVSGTPEERALRRIVEEEKAKGRGRSGSRSREREANRERRHRKRDDDGQDGEERARRRHHHHRRHHREREHSRDRSKNRSRDRESRGHRHRDYRHRERSYDRRRSRSRERRRSYSRDRERDQGRRR